MIGASIIEETLLKKMNVSPLECGMSDAYSRNNFLEAHLGVCQQPLQHVFPPSARKWAWATWSGAEGSQHI